MVSNLSCIGLDIADDSGLTALINAVLPRSARLGARDGVEIFRWQDSSGARLVLGVQDHAVIDFLPSFAGHPGVRVTGCRPLNDDVASADVVDEQGEQTTAMAFELEQRRALAADTPFSGLAAITALGLDVSVHASVAEFEKSRSSLMDPHADPDEPPPPHIAERGMRWPLRMAAESFISYGVFGEPEQAEAYARLNGVVLSSERRRNTLSGNEFVVSRARCVGFEVDILLDGRQVAGAPGPGSVIAGMVYLVGSIDELRF